MTAVGSRGVLALAVHGEARARGGGGAGEGAETFTKVLISGLERPYATVWLC